ncbi:glycoside hydrolase family 19 protein [Burkholderia anthina]|uniref:glycoside hydrolase family 19 protein n=1 Tax=Burkholderia anthina TaxID=179879 RepID=UPI0021AB72DA|nr:glycoside hydrolase family 19 protein [Burkholderia anthina]
MATKRTSKNAPKRATPPKSTPTPAKPALKKLSFAFPLLRKGNGVSDASTRFTDEHDIYRLLAEREPSGTYLSSSNGMWHGGIHITEAGAGQSLDLDGGLRCIADGMLIAFRANKTYPVSEMAAADSGAPYEAPYSTGFALVRHTMEFPRDTKLTFYSLYMHLMSWEDYANFPKREKPSYWPRQWRVTQYAQDKPVSGKNGQAVDPAQQGLRVRKAPNGAPIGIVPQGTSVGIGKIETKHGKVWGQLTDLHGASLYPQHAGGYVEPSSAIGGWVFLGQENGGPVAEEAVEDAMFDRVVVVTDQAKPGDTPGIPIKAGDLIGHLGRYDSLNQRSSGVRMAHVEVFCDDSIRPFLEQGRAWVSQHGSRKEDWAELGLPSEPTILRIEPGTVLYQRTPDNEFVQGADPQSGKTDRVQVYSLAELARDSRRRVPVPGPNPDPGYPVSWWHVDGVNAHGHAIEGWVCDFNFAGGRVTREFAQKWIDFECLADTHDPAHTIFATTQSWIDYASGANAPDLASCSKLSPLMLKVYDALYKRGDGSRAADELCTLSTGERDGYPWLMQAASRLIVKHESEWANPSKWKQLIAELEKQTGPKPQHEEERKRIEKLAWWDEVGAGVPGFPGAEVFHVNAIGMIGNFFGGKFQFTMQMMRRIFPGAQVGDLQAVIDEFNAHIDFYKLDSPLRRAHFFAQVMQETGPSLNIEEGFVWKADSLIKKFSYFKKNPKIAKSHGYDKKRGVKADGTPMSGEDFEIIANGAYGGRAELGNGDYDSGDGWRYRGRGMKQLTGRANYRDFTSWNKRNQAQWPDDIPNFEENPDLLVQAKYAARSAAYFWVSRQLPAIADRGATANQVDAITAVINKKTDSYAKRVENFEKINARGDLN